MKNTCRLPVRNSNRLKICHYMCVFHTEISQFRFLRPVTGEAPTEHISYSVYIYIYIHTLEIHSNTVPTKSKELLHEFFKQICTK